MVAGISVTNGFAYQNTALFDGNSPGASDYTISYVAGTLTVTPAPLTITPSNQTKVYGAALLPAHGQLHQASSMATPRPA